MKPRLRLGFADFWARFDPRRNWFLDLLSPHYEIEVSEQPDFLIYSCFGVTYRRHQGIRIYFSGENTRPDFRQCDYALTFDHSSHPDHFRLPLYALYSDLAELVKTNFDPERVLAAKTGFCNFVYSNPRCPQRIEFFHQLSRYKQVDSGGKLLNNIGGPVADKLAFVKKYKFTIAFENSSHPGYTTEKITEPMRAESLPIYWGNPLVAQDFNPASFINYHDHESMQAVIQRVIELDRHNDRYCDVLRQPWFHENRVPKNVDPATIVAHFGRIFETPRTPVARQRTWRKTFLIDRLWPSSRPYAKTRVKKSA